MSRTLTFDFRRGGGSPVEFLYGEVLLEATSMFTTGTSTVLPSPTRIPLVNGTATVTEVGESPSGPTPAWVYNVTVRDSQTGRAWSRLIGVPAGTGTLNFKDAPVYSIAGSTGPNVVVVQHSASHATGGLDPLTPAAIGALPASNLVWSHAAGRTLTVLNPLSGLPQLVYGDTGERDITGGVTPYVSGSIRISRAGTLVQLELDGLIFQSAAASFIQLTGFIPAGFRPASSYVWANTVARSSQETVSAMRVSKYGEMTVYGVAANETQYGLFLWRTTEPWPTTLPGTAVGSIPA